MALLLRKLASFRNNKNFRFLIFYLAVIFGYYSFSTRVAFKYTIPKHITILQNDQLIDYITMIENIKPDRNICKLPVLQMNGHENFEKERECKMKSEWGYIQNNRWYLMPRPKPILARTSCLFRPIYRIDDFKYSFGNWSTLLNGQLVEDDVFEVECKRAGAKKDATYNNLFVQIVPKKFNEFNSNVNKKSSTCKPMNIILLSYDSVSRVSWLKRAPKSAAFALNTMNFTLLNGYNIVGDGTPAALIPIYTGKTEEELPSVLKSDPNGRYVDEAYPFIWKELHKNDYVSLQLDDWPQVSAFSFRMRGFLNHTASHYFKHYQLRLWERVSPFYFSPNSKDDDFCMGSKKRHKILLDLMLDFKRVYQRAKNNIAIMHYVENSHDTSERFNWVDNDLYEFLNTGYSQGLFNNTAIFLFSDHGARFNDKRESDNRYIEERLPFFAVYLPEEFKLKNQDQWKNLLKNANLLTSPFDIHATVREMTCLDSLDEANETSRSISLLKEISPYRNCDHIGISNHYCSCVEDWKRVNTSRKNIQSVANYVVTSINNITESFRHLCSEFNLREIISAEVLMKKNSKLYRIQLLTEPNNGTYEVVVYKGRMKNFEFNSNTFSIKSRNEISRIDAYGSQPQCVANLTGTQFFFLDLRKFCFCLPKLVNYTTISE